MVEHSKDLDDVLMLLGDPGMFQIIQFILLSLQFVPLAMSDMVQIFYGLQPRAVQIINDNFTSVEKNATSFEHLTFLSSAACSAPNFSTNSNFTYVYSNYRQWSIIGDMNLICDKFWIVSFATTAYFLGQIVASPVSGWLADKFGRRPTLFATNILYTAFSVGIAFSRDYISFIILRFCIGMVRQGMNSAFYILMMEWIPAHRRISWAALAQFFFNLGILILALIAYLLQNWHHIQIFVALSNIVALAFFWFAPESLRWLLVKNRVQEAQDVCVRVAKFNRIPITPETLKNIEDITTSLAGRETQTDDYSVLDCFKTFYVRLFTLLCCFIWVAILVFYFGMLLLLSHISGNIYANFAITACLELVPRVIGLVLTQKIGNRISLVGYFMVAGMLAIIAGFIPGSTQSQEIAKSATALIARMAIVGCFALAYTFSSELFPTVIRNSGFGLCCIAMRVGSMIAPQIVLVATMGSFPGLAFLVMGTIALLGGVASLFLPETKGEKLLATIEEVETFGKQAMQVVTRNLKLPLEVLCRSVIPKPDIAEIILHESKAP